MEGANDLYEVDELVAVPSLKGEEVLKITAVDNDEGVCTVQVKESLEEFEVKLNDVVRMSGVSAGFIKNKIT